MQVQVNVCMYIHVNVHGCVCFCACVEEVHANVDGAWVGWGRSGGLARITHFEGRVFIEN